MNTGILQVADTAAKRRVTPVPRRKKRRASTSCKTGTNPFLKLPVETIGEIFVFSHNDHSNIVDPTMAPLVLLQVCRRWRDIALSTPEIWRVLSVDFDADCIPNAAQKLHGIVGVVDAWLARAHGIVHRVALSQLGPIRLAPQLGALFATLQRHSRAFVCLDLIISDLDIPLLNSFPMQLPVLERLSLAVTDDCDLLPPPAGGPRLDILLDAPRLRRVSLKEIPTDMVALPGPQIDDFSLWLQSGQECLESLVLFPEMTVCVLQPTLYDYDRTLAGLTAITHPHIKNLLLSEDVEETRGWEEDGHSDAERPPHIMSFLTLPALETIEIHGADRLNPHILRAFLERSSPPLHSMTFHPIHEQEMPSMDAFHGLDRLERLEVRWPSSELLEALCSQLAANATFLPNLTLLTFRMSFLALHTELQRQICLRTFVRVLKQRAQLCINIQLGTSTFFLPRDIILIYGLFLWRT